MALHSIGAASALPIALALIPSMPRPVLKRLVERMIDRIDVLEADADLEDDDPDTGAEDDPLSFDPETDQCEVLDHGMGTGLMQVDRKEVRRLQQVARALVRRQTC